VRVFGELETVVMDQLWSLGGTATVREIFERLNADRAIAYTTVALDGWTTCTAKGT